MGEAIFGSLFLAGVLLVLMGLLLWFLYKRLPQETRELTRLSYREGVKALGYENARLKPLGDWDARRAISAFGQAKMYAAYRTFLVIGLASALVGLIGGTALQL